MATMNIHDLIDLYNSVVGGVDEEARASDRAYGGVLRAKKGKLVEVMARRIVELAWRGVGGHQEQLSFDDVKTFRISVGHEYVLSLPEPVRKYVEDRFNMYHYNVRVDTPVFVNGKLIMGIECKSYTENAMLKRIMIDFRMLKSSYPDLVCCLLQLESQLGGDYGDPLANPQMGSPSSHTVMSFFPEIDLNVVTMLRGERKVDRPIHKPGFLKVLRPQDMEWVVARFARLLEPFARTGPR